MRFAFAMLLVAACAPASPQVHGPEYTDESGMICRNEAPTGTNLPRKICRTPERMEDDRREAQEFLSRPERRRNN